MRALLIHVAEVDVVPVQFELVKGQNPALLALVPQSLGPPRRPYYLIGPPLRLDAGECLAHSQDVLVCGVTFDALAVHPPDVGCPAIVVCIGQATGLAVALGDARTVRNARQEVVAFLKGLDADPMLSG